LSCQNKDSKKMKRLVRNKMRKALDNLGVDTTGINNLLSLLYKQRFELKVKHYKTTSKLYLHE